ncbi:hypothetical protein ACNKHP_00345 [Shigella boydii]
MIAGERHYRSRRYLMAIQQNLRNQVDCHSCSGSFCRLPFWRGEGNGRPAEFGEMIGDFLICWRMAHSFPELFPRGWQKKIRSPTSRSLRSSATRRASFRGVAIWSSNGAVMKLMSGYYLHSPCGSGYMNPGRCAIAGRIHALWGADASVVASDDGIVARIPDTDGKLPDAAIFLFEPEKLLRIVREAVGSSALFAAGFANAPRGHYKCRPRAGPSHPLWQQRLRASQLLEIAQGYPDFPVILETLRECLQDLYDLPALERLMRRLNGGEIQISDVTTTTPSPFATSLLFGYVAEFMYRATPRWQSAGHPYCRWTASSARSTRTGQCGGIARPQVIRQVEESCNDWLLAEERKVKKDCSTCCANWGR